MENSSEMKSGIGSFPRSFWVANVMELFERGAYYGLNALLAIYLSEKVANGGLGFTEDMVGLLQSFVYAVTYVIPILGGALADRYGYRKMLLFAFSLLAAGYFVAGQVNTYGVIFVSLLVMATGSGLFKPIISGTIARTTNEKNSGFGFGVYYWMINLGALVAPLVAGYIRDSLSWSWVFTISAIYCALMLLPAAFLYRDPPKPESRKNLKEVLSGALTVLSDARFMLLIFVYSCFWILYFQNFGSVLWYLRDFIDPAPITRFFARMGMDYTLRPEHVTVVNAGTIVLLQIFVNLIVKNIKPLPTMVGGILIGSAGFFVLAMSQNAWIFILGIAVFSIGEMTCHPKYYSYIGIVAPQEKKATYMGYAFLYGVIGSLVGSNVGGEMYRAILSPIKEKALSAGLIPLQMAGAQGTLRNFWLVFAALGIVTTLGLVLYNKLFGEDSVTTRVRARKVMFFIYGLLTVLSVAMVFFVNSTKGSVPPKTWIQSTIMILIGIGGLYTLLKNQTETDFEKE
ncbi:MAG: MFS transporter [Candidatus Krumholzibacteriota bacterium]|nr:MFS transporter [Candidatus Krumholzibacteriota bacterium]